MPARNTSSAPLVTTGLHAEIDSSVREFIAAARDLAFKGEALRQLLNRTLHHATLAGRRRPRCGAPTSLNRPCRGKLEPGETRCPRHLSIDDSSPTTMEGILSRAMPLLAVQPRAVRIPKPTKAPIVCGANTPQGPCDVAIEPGGFRCRLHAEELRKRRANRRRE